MKCKKEIMDAIVNSPQSCALMKEIIANDLNNYLLKEKPPDLRGIRVARNLLKLASVAEEIFKR